MEGVYFVASNSDEPKIIYFTEEDAFDSGYLFIDIFDEDGEKIDSYKLSSDIEEGQSTTEEDYTTNF